MSCQPCYNTVKCWVPPFTKKQPSCADLSVRIDLLESPTRIIYNIIVTNNGPAIANNVILNVSFTGTIVGPPPFPGPAYVGIPPPYWSILGSNGSLDIGTLNSQQTYFIEDLYPYFNFNKTLSSSMTATVTSSTPDCDPSNNTASASYTPPPSPP